MIRLRRNRDGKLVRFATPSGALQGLTQDWVKVWKYQLEINDPMIPGDEDRRAYLESELHPTSDNCMPDSETNECYYSYYNDDPYYWRHILITFKILGGDNNEVMISFSDYHYGLVASGYTIVEDIPLLCDSTTMVCGSMQGTYTIPFDQDGEGEFTNGYATISQYGVS